MTTRRSRRRRSRLLAFAAVVSVAFAGLTAQALTSVPMASALSGSEFDAGNIISDEVFFDSGAMSADDIQSFLYEQVVTCVAANGQPCLKDFRQTTTTRAADSLCGAYQGAANETAARIIKKVADACSINPEVLLVLLQKEQSLVTSTSPTSVQYRSATGYGCPDTAPCATEYYGFFNQVYNAAHQFQRYTKNPNSYNFRAGRWNTIGWHPNAACGGSQVWIANQATANLYIYTPYQPNAAALANLYGTGDTCSSYGNRNFWRIFNEWFGNPGNWLRSPSFEGGSTAGWAFVNGFVNRAAYNDPSTAHGGNWLLAANTAAPGRSISQDVGRRLSVGEQATASVWVRSASGQAFNGTLAVWGLGGTTESRSVAFSATGSWQQISVGLPARASAHDRVRIEVYLDSTDGTLYLDDFAVSFGPAPYDGNVLTHPSFEGSFAGWVPGNGFVNQQVWRDPSAADGSWFAASNTSVPMRSFAQTFPVSARDGDSWTFSIQLRGSDAGKRFTGQVVVWALGGSQQFPAITPFDVGESWERISTTIDLGNTRPTALKVEVYMNSTDNTLWLDDARLARTLFADGSFENGAFPLSRPNAATNIATYASGPGVSAPHGTWFGATNTSASGSSLTRDVAIDPAVPQKMMAELWVRSSGPAFNGRLAVWALGGNTEAASVAFTATDAGWQKLQMPILLQQPGHTTLRFEIYLDSTDATLYIDGARLY